MPGNHRNGGLLYSRLSDYYDTLYQWVTLPRQRAMIQSIGIRPGAKVMDLGVGTGMSLPHYPKHCRVTGIDLSPRMLRHARRRVEMKNLTHVDLHEMDAHDIDRAFPPDSFDLIIAAFVLSVVKDPLRVLENMKTVGKPDCSIFILNYLPGTNPAFARLEKIIEPLTRRIGWNYALDLPTTIDRAGLNLVSCDPCHPLDWFSVAHVRNGRA